MRFFMISDLHLSNQGSTIADSTFQALYEKIMEPLKTPMKKKKKVI